MDMQKEEELLQPLSWEEVESANEEAHAYFTINDFVDITNRFGVEFIIRTMDNSVLERIFQHWVNKELDNG
jgi:hypothetical protein